MIASHPWCKRGENLPRRTDCNLNRRSRSCQVWYRTAVGRQSDTEIERREDERKIGFDDVLDQEGLVPKLLIARTNGLDLAVENSDQGGPLDERVLPRGTLEQLEPLTLEEFELFLKFAFTHDYRGGGGTFCAVLSGLTVLAVLCGAMFPAPAGGSIVRRVLCGSMFRIELCGSMFRAVLAG